MTSGIRKGIGILRAPKTSLFLCDMQEKFRPNIKFFDEIVANSSRVLKAASVMDIPVMATEQYPKGLGPTVPELGLAEAKVKAYSKTCFSMVLPELMEDLKGNIWLSSVTREFDRVLVCLGNSEVHFAAQSKRKQAKFKNYLRCKKSRLLIA